MYVCWLWTQRTYWRAAVPTNDLAVKMLRGWPAFKLHCTAKYGLEAMAINYRKATSTRLVVRKAIRPVPEAMHS